MIKALLYLACFLAAQVTSAFIVQVIVRIFFPHLTSDNTTLLLASTALGAVILIALFLAMRWCTVSRNYIRTRPWGFLSWCVLLALGMVIPLTWVEEHLPDFLQVNIITKEMAGMLRSSEGYFVICMLAPLMEEILFRGAMIPALMKWREKKDSPAKARWMAIGISTVFFALAHANPAQIPHALIAGTLLGWLYTKTHSIVPGLIIHWINNSAAYAIANMFPTLPIDAKLADYFNGNQWGVLQAVIASLLIAAPSLYQLIIRHNSPDYNLNKR